MIGAGLSFNGRMHYLSAMAQRKPPNLTTGFMRSYPAVTARAGRSATRTAAPAAYVVPPEHLDGLLEGLAQIERGEILGEAELEALLAPDPTH